MSRPSTRCLKSSTATAGDSSSRNCSMHSTASLLSPPAHLIPTSHTCAPAAAASTRSPAMLLNVYHPMGAALGLGSGELDLPELAMAMKRLHEDVDNAEADAAAIRARAATLREDAAETQRVMEVSSTNQVSRRTHPITSYSLAGRKLLT